MITKQLNPYADLLATCRGDRRYRGEIAAEDCLLVGVLAGELRVVQAHHTLVCRPGDTLLLPRRQPATLVKLPQAGTIQLEYSHFMNVPSFGVSDKAN